MVLALNNVTDSINFAPPVCEPLSIDLTSTLIGSEISTNIHCSVANSIGAQISVVMMSVWSIVGFVVFARA